jgi:hypothetical protein
MRGPVIEQLECLGRPSTSSSATPTRQTRLSAARPGYTWSGPADAAVVGKRRGVTPFGTTTELPLATLTAHPTAEVVDDLASLLDP